MHLAHRITLLGACAAVIAGCAAPESHPARVGAAPSLAPMPPTARSAPAPAPDSGFTAAERSFVTHVATRTAYEIEVSKLAAERAISPAVREHAATLVQRDTQLSSELAGIMGTHGITPPRGLPADKATKLHRLAGLPRSEAFDTAYIRVVGIEDQRKAIAMFEKARQGAKDRALRAWIDRSLASMRAQLTAAQSVASSLAG